MNKLRKFSLYLIAPIITAIFIAGSVSAYSAFTVIQGGTGVTNVPNGSLLTGSSTNKMLNVLAPGSEGTVLKISSGVPAWGTAAAGDVVGPAGASDGDLVAFDTNTGKLLKDSSINPLNVVQAGDGLSRLNDDVGYLTTVSGLNISIFNNDEGYISTESDPASLHLDQTTPQTIINGVPSITNGLLVGATANITDWSTAKIVGSQADSAYSYTGNIGIVGESVASASDTGTGVGGVSVTNGSNEARGVTGVGKVGATGDTAKATGIYGYVNGIHAGGDNIGVRGSAINGANNYSFYGENGNIYNNGDVTLASGKGYKITGGASSSFLKADGSLDSSTYLTAISSHASTHSVGGADAVFPADPGADKFLKWNNTSNLIEWADASSSGANTALSNLSSVAINTTLLSDTDNTDALGTTAIAWSDLFLGNGAVVTFNSAPSTPDITITHSANALAFAGGTVSFDTAPTVGVASILYSGGALGTPSSGTVTNLTGTASININGTVGATTPTTGVFTTATINTGLLPDANDGAYIGNGTTAFSDLFLASGGVINWANGASTLTHSANLLTIGGSGVTTLALGTNSLTMTGSLAATGARVTKGWFTDIESTNMPTVGGTSIATTFAAETATTIGALINGATTKDTPVDADLFGYADTEASNVLKKFTWANIKARLKTYFDGFYLLLAGGTMTGEITLAENAAIVHDNAMSADGKYTGEVINGTAGAALAFGDLVYLDPTDSRWELADANVITAADGDSRGILAMVVLAAAGDGSATKLLLRGFVRADAVFPTFTVNAPIYVSETAGDVTETQPTTADVLIRVIGFGFDGNTLYFNPSNDYITHS